MAPAVSPEVDSSSLSRRLVLHLAAILGLMDLAVAAMIMDYVHVRDRREALASINGVFHDLPPTLLDRFTGGDLATISSPLRSAVASTPITFIELRGRGITETGRPFRVVEGNPAAPRAFRRQATLAPLASHGGQQIELTLAVAAGLNGPRSRLGSVFVWSLVIGGFAMVIVAAATLTLARHVAASAAGKPPNAIGKTDQKTHDPYLSGLPPSTNHFAIGEPLMPEACTVEYLMLRCGELSKDLDKEVKARRRIEHYLRQSEQTLADAQRLAHTGSWQWNLATNAVDCSEELYRIYGLDPLDTEPGFTRLIAALHEDDRQEVLPEFSAHQSEKVISAQEYRIRRPDGSIRWLHCRREPCAGEDGRVTHVRGIAVDITDRKMTEQAMKQLNEQLEYRVEERTRQLQMINRELDAFSFSVSHDLRAPLRTIRSFSTILLENYGGSLEPGSKQCIESIQRSATDMADLIQGLLMLSRTSKGELRREPTNLSDICLRIIDRLREQEPDRNVAVTIHSGMMGFASRQFLEIALSNLITNAWKYTRYESQPQIDIGVTNSAVSAARKAFYIRDNGVGFEMRYASRLFQPFQRLHSPNRFEGNGIGLAIVSRIIARHEGEIWGEGAVNEGAAFYFTLPEEQLSAVGDREGELSVSPDGRS